VNAGLVRADCTQCAKIGENARAVDAREVVNHGFTYLRARSSPGVNKVPDIFYESRTKFRDRASRVDYPEDSSASAMTASHATMTSAATAPAAILAFSFDV